MDHDEGVVVFTMLNAQKGQAGFEFIAVLPFLLLVFAICFEVAQLYIERHMLSLASFEAARYCLLGEGDQKEREKQALEILRWRMARVAPVSLISSQQYFAQTQNRRYKDKLKPWVGTSSVEQLLRGYGVTKFITSLTCEFNGARAKITASYWHLIRIPFLSVFLQWGQDLGAIKTEKLPGIEDVLKWPLVELKSEVSLVQASYMRARQEFKPAIAVGVARFDGLLNSEHWKAWALNLSQVKESW